MPHAAAAKTIGSPRPLLTAFAPLVPPSAGSATQESSSASPEVRRLRFPAAAPKLKPSPRPSTRFADSVGQGRPAIESSSDLGIDQSVPPEDLPQPGSQASTADPARDLAAEPGLLLRRAGALFSSAKDTALDLSGRGLESGRVLAHQMSDALRERLERKRPEADEPKRSIPSPRPHAEALPPTSDLPQLAARRQLLALGRQGAGPLLALVAALGMFLGSRHILGSGGIGLSSTAPAIPELGELSKASPGARTTTPKANAPAADGSGTPAGPPPAMATEVIALPPGMAWPGKGLLEVVTSEDELVYVDGVFTGRGPLRRVPVTPGEHEVSIRKEGSVRQGTAKVEPNRTTRAVFPGK